MKTVILLAILTLNQLGVVYSTDWDCMSDCQQRYGYGYCQKMCSY